MIEYVDIDAGSEVISDNYSSMCRRLITKIFQVQNKYTLENGVNFDRVYVPHTILNVLSDASGFSSYGITEFSEDQPIGKLGGRIDIYVSFSMNRNQILFSFDKRLIRDNKLESLLDDQTDYNLQEVTLEIKSEFLL